MNIGSLKHRISLEAQTKTPDGMGGFLIVWTEMASDVPAAIWGISANEQIQNQSVAMTMSHRIRIRYRSDIRSSWRLKYKNSYFDIVSIVNPNMSNRMLDVMVKAV